MTETELLKVLSAAIYLTGAAGRTCCSTARRPEALTQTTGGFRDKSVLSKPCTLEQLRSATGRMLGMTGERAAG